MEWNPEIYAKSGGLRLRPSLDLLAQVPALPAGNVVDLGCGSGAVGATLKARFGRRLVGVDSAATMLEKADETGDYDALLQADIAGWRGADAPAICCAFACASARSCCAVVSGAV